MGKEGEEHGREGEKMGGEGSKNSGYGLANLFVSRFLGCLVLITAVAVPGGQGFPPI